MGLRVKCLSPLCLNGGFLCPFPRGIWIFLYLDSLQRLDVGAYCAKENFPQWLAPHIVKIRDDLELFFKICVGRASTEYKKLELPPLLWVNIMRKQNFLIDWDWWRTKIKYSWICQRKYENTKKDHMNCCWRTDSSV